MSYKLEKERYMKMSCSVRTGSAGSGGSLQSISYNFSLSKYDSFELKFSDIFPNITPKYAFVEFVYFTTLNLAGQTTNVGIKTNQSSFTIEEKDGRIESVMGKVTALY